jgi:hypothetical protein
MEFEASVRGQDRLGAKTSARPIVTARDEIGQMAAMKKAAKRLKGVIDMR